MVLGVVALTGCLVPLVNLASLLQGLVGVALAVTVLARRSPDGSRDRRAAVAALVAGAVAVLVSLAVLATLLAVADTALPALADVLGQVDGGPGGRTNPFLPDAASSVG